MAKCSVEGCDGISRTKGLCQMHYARFWRTGTVDAPKPSEQRTKHPLYITWMSAKRGGVLCDEWRDDFNRFLAEVGAAPEGATHRLYRRDTTLPYSKENVYWKEVSPGKQFGEDAYEYQKRMQRGKKHEYLSSRKRTLKNVYGISLEQYAGMLEAQGGVCAICGRHETRTDARNGKVRHLSVDHCHKTRKVRGLLCSKCNIGLGKFDDSEEMLYRAIAYKQKYKFD